jgi:hypothetical protein
MAVTAALLTLGAARADEPTTAKEKPQILVTGRRALDEKSLRAATREFGKSHGSPAVVTGQLARWRSPICPLTRGLAPGFNAFGSARVRAIAASVGAPVDESEQCTPNAEIIFTTEPQKLLEDVVSHHEILLGFHWISQTKKVATFHPPIQAWYVTATRGRSGQETVDDQIEYVYGTTPPGTPGSHFVTGRSTSIVHVLVVADTSKLNDFTIGSISDYVAMLLLAQPQTLNGCTELPSILDLLSSECGARQRPEAISASDSAYLRALYAVDLELTLPLERSAIYDHMTRELEGQR